MKTTMLITLAMAIALSGCQKPEDWDNGLPIGPGAMNRYHGIGIYSVDDLWEQLVRKEQPRDASAKDPQAALLEDDTQIIVSVDSRTGEIRQCGNYSGHCLSANPWKAPADAAPAALPKHTADLVREREARARTPSE